MAHSIQAVKRTNYGLDAPGLVRGFLMGGAALIALGLAARVWAPNTLVFFISVLLLWPLAIFFVEGILMVWSSRVGKFHERDRLLDGLDLRGDETVLDVGPGHGLLMIGAAKR